MSSCFNSTPTNSWRNSDQAESVTNPIYAHRQSRTNYTESLPIPTRPLRKFDYPAETFLTNPPYFYKHSWPVLQNFWSISPTPACIHWPIIHWPLPHTLWSIPYILQNVWAILAIPIDTPDQTLLISQKLWPVSSIPADSPDQIFGQSHKTFEQKDHSCPSASLYLLTICSHELCWSKNPNKLGVNTIETLTMNKTQFTPAAYCPLLIFWRSSGIAVQMDKQEI